MHDLNTINRLNYEAFAKSIDHFRAQGRYVVATYEGLHLVAIETHGDAGGAIDHFTRPRDVGQSRTLFEPFPSDSAHAALHAGRDQSEDRAPVVAAAQLANTDPLRRTGGGY